MRLSGVGKLFQGEMMKTVSVDFSIECPKSQTTINKIHTVLVIFTKVALEIRKI